MLEHSASFANVEDVTWKFRTLLQVFIGHWGWTAFETFCRVQRELTTSITLQPCVQLKNQPQPIHKRVDRLFCNYFPKITSMPYPIILLPVFPLSFTAVPLARLSPSHSCALPSTPGALPCLPVTLLCPLHFQPQYNSLLSCCTSDHGLHYTYGQACPLYISLPTHFHASSYTLVTYHYVSVPLYIPTHGSCYTSSTYYPRDDFVLLLQLQSFHTCILPVGHTVNYNQQAIQH